MLQKGQISQSTCNYLTTNIDRTQQCYLSPKIHKDPHNPLGRPIVSGSAGPTDKISQFVDHFIGPLVPLSQSYIRNLTHLVNILNKLTMQPGMILCTLDIPSLYTNIPHNEGIQSIKVVLAVQRTAQSLPHNSYIIELFEVVLMNNHFWVWVQWQTLYQMSGTAVGTKLAPSYANLFMTKFEEKYAYTYPLQPKQWKWFIDDIFPHVVIWIDSLLEFINHWNTVHSTIKFTSDISPTEISFLDLILYSKGSRLYTRLHTKTTDRLMYLNFSSEHPVSLKWSIPYSQFPRLKRIHTEPQYLLEAEIYI